MTTEIERVEGEVVDTVKPLTEGADKEGAAATSNAIAPIEFKLIDPTEDGFIKVIRWNKEELKEAITAIMQKYDGAKYDNIQTAKADRASLNKLIKAIDDKRKEVKKKYLEPYNAFEADVKEILELIKTPTAAIDTVIKKEEQRQKEEKRSQLKAMFDQERRKSENSLINNYIEFDDVFEESYLNATTTLSKAWALIHDKMAEMKRNLEIIENDDSPHADAVKSVYLRTHDLSIALEEKTRLQKLAAEREEKERKEQERKEAQLKEEQARKAEEAKAQAATQEVNANDERGSDTVANKQPDGTSGAATTATGADQQGDLQNRDKDSGAETQPEPIVQATFRVFGTVSSLKALALHMKTCGLKFEAVK